MDYRFFSKCQGWLTGYIAKYYISGIYKDTEDNTSVCVGKSGADILKLKLTLPKEFIKLCEIYKKWYYYPADTVIYENRYQDF